MPSRTSYPKSHNTQPLKRRHNLASDQGSTRPTSNLEPGTQLHATVTEAWDNGNIAIQTWTLPSGNVPILTLTPESNFIQALANFRIPGILVDKLTEGVRNSVATEGDRLHDDLVCALAYALVNHGEEASDWWLSVGIVSQGIFMRGEEVDQPIHELVHPSWSSQVAKVSYPSGRAVG